MRLLSQAPIRYVLLVVDDHAESVAARIRGAPVAAEVVAVTSTEAAASALVSGRRYSALLAVRVDPDLADLAARAGAPTIEVGWAMTPQQLAVAIADVADPVAHADWRPELGPTSGWEPSPRDAGAEGRLVAVCGPGGTGASSVAAALAAAFALSRPAGCGRSDSRATSLAVPMSSGLALGRPSGRGRPMRVLLADFALRADQAFLHGADDPPPGLLDLVGAGRYRPISIVDAGQHTLAVGGRRLLPGLRRAEHWTAISAAAFDRTLSGLLGMFDLVVADITGEFEGEVETGSVDVEERNHMARASARMADVVVVVGGAGGHGARRLARLVDALLDLGVDPARIQPVINMVVGPWLSDPAEPRVCGLPAAPIRVPFLDNTAGGRRPYEPAAGHPPLEPAGPVPGHTASRLAPFEPGASSGGDAAKGYEPELASPGETAPRLWPMEPAGQSLVGKAVGSPLAPDGVEMVAVAIVDRLARLRPPDRRPVPARVIPGSLGCAAP